MSVYLTNNQIVRGLLQQEDAVINYLYEEIGPKVKQYIMSVGGSAEEANDIFQEGIVSAYVNIKSGKYKVSENTKFTTYLIQICKYKWYDNVKSAHHSKNTVLDMDVKNDDDILGSLIQDEKYSQLHKLIDELDEKCREILHRYYWLKESMADIAKALKMVTASVKNGKYRCMQKLKDNSDELKIFEN